MNDMARVLRLSFEKGNIQLLKKTGNLFDMDYTNVFFSVIRFEESMRRDNTIKGIVDRNRKG
ncbi:MAG: hypothetical protein GWP03_00075 [Proteobacteria bacterium]|nr:hypothetical protein [Pseudomonadota bacterium]